MDWSANSHYRVRVNVSFLNLKVPTAPKWLEKAKNGKIFQLK